MDLYFLCVVLLVDRMGVDMSLIILAWVMAIIGWAIFKWHSYKARQSRAKQLMKLGVLCQEKPMNNIERLERWALLYAPMKIIDRGFEFDNSKIFKRMQNKKHANVIPMRAIK